MFFYGDGKPFFPFRRLLSADILGECNNYSLATKKNATWLMNLD